MILTGKCKVDFESFMFNWLDENVAFDCESSKEEDLNHFYKFPQSMQYGVYLDFFNSLGIRIVIDMDFENEVYDKFALYIEYKENSFCSYGMNFKTRQEARTAAIKKANEIYNKLMN